MDKRDERKAVPFPEELARLEMVRGKIAAALDEAQAAVERHQRNYSDFMAYMAQHHGEIDPKEIFQSEQLLEQEGYTGLLALKTRDSLEKLLDSPYFGRIDFECDDPEYTGVYYVGRSAFSAENRLYMLDWRAPLASMFYDFELGPAFFDAPAGHIEGTLAKKRQFRITDGRMEYAVESSTAIRDEVLQRELSSTSDEKMRSIIATIQREQNLIIREEKATVMIIQGVAGSGKTSIALHRIAYLLYRFKHTLSASNVVILSPNRVFSDHIANVLPELGEQPVYQMGFWQLARAQLEGIQGFYPKPDPLENRDAALAERDRYKAAPAFLHSLDSFIAHTAQTVFEPQDYVFGPFTATGDWMWARWQAYARLPIKRRIREIAGDIRDRFESRNIREDTLPAQRQILKALNAMLRIRTTRALYKALFHWLGKPRYLVVKDGSLEWADVYPFLYLQAAFEGLRENHRIRHLVVDEMQDYTPVQFAVLKKLFHCNMTILGDFSQTLDPAMSHTLEDLCALWPAAKLMRLEKSYRSTWEIIEYAAAIRPGTRLDAVKRHGEKPRLILCGDGAEQLERIKGLITEFKAGKSGTLGILTKHQQEARLLHEALAGRVETSLIGPESEHFAAGVSILSVGMSKGLEFDEVILPDVDGEHYAAPHDRNLLYVACTRAMHRLTLLCCGAPSPLLPANFG